jgi:hypothetical protein
MSIAGCSHDYGQNFCSGFQSGPSTTATTSITLQPNAYGVSVNYGATNEVVTPTAFTCKGTPSGLNQFTYGSSDLTIADVSPAGQICGGTWNRNSPNGVANFTTCIPTNKTGIAYVTASGGGATSNVVPVFVHPQVTSVVLGATAESCPAYSNPANGQISPNPVTLCTTLDPTNPANNLPKGCTPAYNPQPSPIQKNSGCISQNDTAPLAATVYGDVNGVTTDITCSVGHLIYTPQNANIVTVDQNGIATAHQPGATVLSASVAQASSTAGYFFTCPPASIALKVGTTNQGQPPLTPPVTINQTNIQPLTTTVLDTHGNPITGLALSYTSTDPINIAVNGSGVVTGNFPSDADIVAQCLPSICNPAPLDQIANLGTGLPVTSNPIAVTTPGPSSTVLYLSSPQSYGFVPIDFLIGTVGTPVTLPYLPNSMVMDQIGASLYFGSSTQLMIATTASNSLTKEDSTVPGTVLAVAPNDSLVVIHDPCRKLFYLYNPGTGTSLAFAAPGPTIACNANSQPVYPAGVVNPVYSTQNPGGEVNPPYSATFTEDSQNLYITYSNPADANTPGAATLFAYSPFTGWHTCTDNGNNPATNCPVSSSGTAPVPSVAVTVPAVGVYTSTAGGTAVTAFSYCATGPNNTAQNPNAALNPTNFYPPVGTVTDPVDQLVETTDGRHIIGATAATDSITDVNVTIPAGACPLTTNLQFGPPPNVAGTPYTTALGATDVASINKVLTSPASTLAFVTYYSTTPGASGNTTLPAYKIPSTGAGQVVPITLTGTAPGAPIAGVFSPDTTTFYVSTDQDDLVHFINTTTLTDTQQINPALLNTSGKQVPAFFMAARPRPVQ